MKKRRRADGAERPWRMVVVRYVKVKSLLSPTKLGTDFVINPYAGCPHGCVYCYASCMRGAAGRGGG